VPLNQGVAHDLVVNFIGLHENERVSNFLHAAVLCDQIDSVRLVVGQVFCHDVLSSCNVFAGGASAAIWANASTEVLIKAQAL